MRRWPDYLDSLVPLPTALTTAATLEYFRLRVAEVGRPLTPAEALTPMLWAGGARAGEALARHRANVEGLVRRGRLVPTAGYPQRAGGGGVGRGYAVAIDAEVRS